MPESLYQLICCALGQHNGSFVEFRRWGRKHRRCLHCGGDA